MCYYIISIPNELKHGYIFIPGQFLKIQATIDGRYVSRCYSICSAPFENDMKFLVKKLKGGLFSSYANNCLKKGDMLQVSPPIGSFFKPEKYIKGSRILALVSGSGIGPVFSIIKETLRDPESHFVLVCGNRDKDSIIFHDALKKLQTNYPTRLDVLHF